MALLFAMCSGASAQTPGLPPAGNEKARQEFADSKFGIFIHFGIYSMVRPRRMVFKLRERGLPRICQGGIWLLPLQIRCRRMGRSHKSIRGTVCLLHHAPPRRLLDVRHGIFGLRHRGRVALQKRHCPRDGRSLQTTRDKVPPLLLPYRLDARRLSRRMERQERREGCQESRFRLLFPLYEEPNHGINPEIRP